jgi:hypothetical protein
MQEVFVDTVHLLALVNPRDQWRDIALDRAATITAPLVTTHAVLVEVADALCRPGHRNLASKAITTIREDSDVTCVPVDEELFARALALYSERDDKPWSLTDCISFEVMRERRIDRAFTADHHFVQAGFRALLLE